MSRRRLLLLFLAAVVIIASASTPALAASEPCSCNGHGEATLTEPRCICKCTGNYLPPFCAFQTDDIVRVEIWFDLPMRDYISTIVHADLKDQLKVKVNQTLLNKVKFLFLVPSHNNKTMAIFDMPGLAVNWLFFYVWDAHGPAESRWPYQKLKISAIFLTEEQLPASSFVGDLLRSTYLYKDDLLEISLSDVSWLLGVILLIILMPLIDGCCSRNTEKEIEKDIMSGKFDLSGKAGPSNPNVKGTSRAPDYLAAGGAAGFYKPSADPASVGLPTGEGWRWVEEHKLWYTESKGDQGMYYSHERGSYCDIASGKWSTESGGWE